MNIRRIFTFGLTLAAAAALSVSLYSCDGGNPSNGTDSDGGGPDPNGGLGINWEPAYSCASGGSNAGLDMGAPDFGLPNPVVITLNGGDAATVETPASPDVVSVNPPDGGHVELTLRTNVAGGYNIIVRGTTANGSLKVNGRTGATVRFYLDGANITNPDGPALNVQGYADTAVIHLVAPADCDADPKRNILADGANYVTPPGTEQAKGTVFSERRLTITGGGSLEIRSRFRHALVVDNELTINDGNIIIYESASDGIHTNRNVRVAGGKLQIKSNGDAIQVERGNRDINIAGGDVSLFTTGVKSHGLASDSGDVNISGGASVKITVQGNGAKGIRSRRDVTINGGDTYIRALGGIDVTPPDQRDPSDPDSTSRAAGIRAVRDVSINSGTLNIMSTGQSARGINSDGNVAVTGGAANIIANGDGIKVGDEGYFNMSGGTVRVRVSSGQEIDCGGRYTHSGGDLNAVIDGRTR